MQIIDISGHNTWHIIQISGLWYLTDTSYFDLWNTKIYLLFSVNYDWLLIFFIQFIYFSFLFLIQLFVLWVRNGTIVKFWFMWRSLSAGELIFFYLLFSVNYDWLLIFFTIYLFFFSFLDSASFYFDLDFSFR